MESTSGIDEHREINEASTSDSDSSHQAQVRSLFFSFKILYDFTDQCYLAGVYNLKRSSMAY